MKPVRALGLGWQTDLIFARFDGLVLEREDCIVVRTPANPDYHWGNFLLFDRAPVEGDAARWQARFDEEIVRPAPQSRHLAIGVDAEAAFELPADFRARGVSLSATTVLQATRATWRPAAPPPGYAFRAFDLPADAAAAIDLQCVCEAAEPDPMEPVGYRRFRERQMQRYAALQAAGRGHWLGLWRDDRPVAECGLFVDEAGRLARFQHVSTHPAHRRRGLARALVHAACRHGLDRLGAETLVICADPDDVAIGLYESLGFARGATTWQLERRPGARA